MLEKKHNDNSKEFMQKVLVFIDTVLINASLTKPEDVNKVLVSGLLNVRDAMFSDIVRDSQVSEFNNFLKNSSKKNQEVDQNSLNQESESVKDPSA